MKQLNRKGITENCLISHESDQPEHLRNLIFQHRPSQTTILIWL